MSDEGETIRYVIQENYRGTWVDWTSVGTDEDVAKENLRYYRGEYANMQFRLVKRVTTDSVVRA